MYRNVCLLLSPSLVSWKIPLRAARVDQEVSHCLNQLVVLSDAVLEASLIGTAAQVVALCRGVIQQGVESLAREISLVLNHWATFAAHFDFVLFIIIMILN